MPCSKANAFSRRPNASSKADARQKPKRRVLNSVAVEWRARAKLPHERILAAIDVRLEAALLQVSIAGRSQRDRRASLEQLARNIFGADGRVAHRIGEPLDVGFQTAKAAAGVVRQRDDRAENTQKIFPAHIDHEIVHAKSIRKRGNVRRRDFVPGPQFSRVTPVRAEPRLKIRHLAMKPKPEGAESAGASWNAKGAQAVRSVLVGSLFQTSNGRAISRSGCEFFNKDVPARSLLQLRAT